MRYHGTDIDGIFLSPERLEVRGIDLLEIMERMSYPQAVALILLGKAHGPGAPGAVEAVLRSSLAAAAGDAAAIRLIRGATASGASPSQAVIAGLMAAESAVVPLPPLNDDSGALSAAMCEGLAIVGRLPAYVAAAIAESEADAEGRLERARTTPGPYLRRVQALFLDESPTEPQTKALETLFVAWHGGFGYLPPSVMMPRIAIGTGVPMRQALAAGFAAGGPNHIGACEDAIAFLLGCLAHGPADVAAAVDEAIAGLLAQNRRVPGFGHPLFRADPRAPRLRVLAAAWGLEAPALVAYDAATDSMKRRTGLPPNIDFASAALFIAAGIRTTAGGTLALCARGVGMLAHMIERQAKPAFGVTSAMARKQLELLPKNWL